MESLESVMWIFVSAGVILVSTAVLGGGIEVKEIKIPKLNPRVRFFAAILGVVFIVFPVVLPELLSKPRIKTFHATPPRIKTGESSCIDWNVSRAVTVNIQPEIGNVSLSGPATVSPSETTTYTLRARNDAGEEVVRDITVQVEPLLLPVVNSFQATPSRIKAGESSRKRLRRPSAKFKDKLSSIVNAAYDQFKGWGKPGSETEDGSGNVEWDPILSLSNGIGSNKLRRVSGNNYISYEMEIPMPKDLKQADELWNEYFAEIEEATKSLQGFRIRSKREKSKYVHYWDLEKTGFLGMALDTVWLWLRKDTWSLRITVCRIPD